MRGSVSEWGGAGSWNKNGGGTVVEGASLCHVSCIICDGGQSVTEWGKRGPDSRKLGWNSAS